jgi:large subunit ribosomal protein L18
MVMKTSREMGRRRRHVRVRKTLSGTAERARMTVFRSHLHIYAQIVDDTKGHTLVSASSLKLGAAQSGDGQTRQIAQAKAVGLEIAARAKEKGITVVTFDRSGYRYHGRVAALAQGAREGGLQF